MIVSSSDELSMFMYIYVKPQQTKDGASAISSIVHLLFKWRQTYSCRWDMDSSLAQFAM